jgi:hypothetical protein
MRQGAEIKKTSTMIHIRSRRIIKYFLFAILGLVFLNVTGRFLKYGLGVDSLVLENLMERIDFNFEGTITSWYSSGLLLLCSLLLAVIASVKRAARDPHALHWSGLSVVFLYLSIDEAASIHELAISPLRNAFNTGGWLYFPWVIIAAPLLVIFFFVYLKFLAHLPPKTRRFFIVAGAIYVGGALGMELVGGRHIDLWGRGNMAYVLISTIEETLEMIGLVLFVHALLHYTDSNLEEIRFRVSS